jgi:ABC-type transport system involved in multi-copper enzyme maturation permease subunit
VDAYRELNAKRLFWITLVLSGAFIAAFALIGFHAGELTFAGYQMPLLSSEYKPMFSTLVIGLWLTWAALILALISTAGIFPDLLAGGTIDLYLARPMSRLRLFLTKYFCGLLFVAIQVAVVAVGAFIIMRWRGGEWMPSLFLAIPLVVLVFSYIFAVCVLMGVWTRSVIAALLLSILAWGFFSITQMTETGILSWKKEIENRIDHDQRTIADADADLDRYQKHPTDDLLGVGAALAKTRRSDAQTQLPGLQHDLWLPQLLYRFSVSAWLAVPKTSETSDLLDRYLMTDQEAGVPMEQREQRDATRGRPQRQERDDVALEVLEERRHRSVPLILGTSLLDEALCLSLAAWIFCRRDY